MTPKKLSYAARKMRSRLGANIKTRRAELRITQVQLSKRCKIPRPYVSRIECGKIAVSIDLVARIAKALKLEPSSLLKKSLNKIEANGDDVP